MYKHHPYSYICFLFAQNLLSQTARLFLALGTISLVISLMHSQVCFTNCEFFFLPFVIGRVLQHLRIQRNEFELHLLKHINIFMEAVLQKLSNCPCQLKSLSLLKYLTPFYFTFSAWLRNTVDR